MLPLTNSAAWALGLSLLFLSLYQIDLVCAEGESDDSDDGHLRSQPDIGDDLLGVPDDPLSILNQQYPGRTYRYNELSDCISHGSRVGDSYQLQFNSQLSGYMDYKVFIGLLTQVKTIVDVVISFYNQDNSNVLDANGNIIQYKSNPHDCGQMMDIRHQGFPFSYAKCHLKLQPDCDFNPDDLFFHFAEHSSASASSSSSEIVASPTGVITGPTSFSIDSTTHNYSVSIECPKQAFCMWHLDSRVISDSEATSLTLVFAAQDVGNRTLSYVRIEKGSRQILASLLLFIVSNIKPVCANLPKNPKNTWLSAGTMSSPRVYFTATYLRTNGLIMIAGGTTNDATVLSSLDIYDPSTGCCTVLSMTTSRMKHAAVYYNDSDTVLIMGGVEQGGRILASSELASINHCVAHQTMRHSRYFHVADTLSDTLILIVGGQITNITRIMEKYIYTPAEFSHLHSHVYENLANLHGHSVTRLGTSNIALVFGGYNEISYPGVALLVSQATLTNVSVQAMNMIAYRANHQAVYIRSLNATFIAGGNNDTHVFSTCYLYDDATRTFRQTGSMATARTFHAAVRLLNDSVLIIGGAVSVNNGVPHTPTISVERYDPNTGTFVTVANLNQPRYKHAAVLHNDNEIFVIGGMTYRDEVLRTIEFLIYPPGPVG